MMTYTNGQHRFQSESEPAFMGFEDSLTGDLSGVMKRLEDTARPLVGLRSKSTEDWWSYPMVVAYLSIDTSIEGRNGTILDIRGINFIKYYAYGQVHEIS